MGVRIETLTLDDLAGRNSIFQPAIDFHRLGGHAGQQPKRFEALLDRLQIFAPMRDGCPYLHCGANSTTSELFGRDFAAGLVGEPGLSDEAFERTVQMAYHHVAVSGRPVSQRVTAGLTVDGLKHIVSYYQMVFPMTLGSKRVVACLTRFS
ncbi:MAG: hypothetical protein RIB45_09245 [Marivibrio sp.]|uniref:hypothetical protein n=1 Tax=Marivibrio sp. TaxID=2039719 RepID=UPI0032EA92B4